jgi:hypothetical protein
MNSLKPLRQISELKPLIPHKLPESELGNEETDNPEENARRDHIKMMRGLRQQQAEANELANQTDFYRAVYFQTAEQAIAFEKAIGIESGGMFIDGLALARELNIELPPRSGKYKTGVLDKKCTDMAR